MPHQHVEHCSTTDSAPCAPSFISACRGPVFVKGPASLHFPPLSPRGTRVGPPGLNTLSVHELRLGTVYCQPGYLHLQGLPRMDADPAAWASVPPGPKWSVWQEGSGGDRWGWLPLGSASVNPSTLQPQLLLLAALCGLFTLLQNKEYSTTYPRLCF